jgi:hypothetical protein
MHMFMKPLRSASLLLAVLVSACSAVTPEVGYCQVLTAAPEYQKRTCRTEITVVPTRHGAFATTYQCQAGRIYADDGRLDDESADLLPPLSPGLK